jgi:hypothetical protein
MTIKNIFSTSKVLTSLFVFFAFTFLVSCERDRCKTRGINCLNEGVCYDGECNCPLGWTGTLCDTMESFPFTGKYGGIRVFDNGYATDDTLDVFNNTNKTIILNPNTILPVTGNVQNNQFFVPKTAYGINTVLSGTGVLNVDRLSMTVYVDSVVNGVKLKGYKYTFSGDRIK